MTAWISIGYNGSIMPNIEYTETDGRDLDIVTPLRQKLIVHHRERAPEYFQGSYTRMDAAGNNRRLRERHANDSIHMTIARDTGTNKIIAYCISIVMNIHKEIRGEIYSIYVEPEYRDGVIGDNLMERALKWMNGRGAKRIVLAVSAGNEKVFDFYARFNFYPRITLLQQVKSKETG